MRSEICDAEHLQLAVNPWRTPQRIGRHHPFDQAANLGRRGRSASPTAPRLGPPGPESAKPLALPADDGVSLYVEQRAAPAVPNAGQTYPEQSIQDRQDRSFPFSLEGRELKAESGVLDRDG